MTLSIRNTLRTLSALALTAAFLPGCDGEDYEALGLSAEQIDGMSEEELDELAALEDEDELDISAQEHPGEPDPRKVPSDITGPHADGATDAGLSQTFWNPRHTHAAADAGLSDTFWNPRHTHGAADAGLSDTFWNPRHTHSAEDAGLADSFWDPDHTHTAEDAGLADTFWDPEYTHVPAGAPLVEGIANPVHPTHTALGFDVRAEPPEGCQPDQPETVFSNG